MKSVGFAELLTDLLNTRSKKGSQPSRNEENSDFGGKIEQAKSRLQSEISQAASINANNATSTSTSTSTGQESTTASADNEAKSKVTFSFTETKTFSGNDSSGSTDTTSAVSTAAKLEATPERSSVKNNTTQYAGMTIKSGQIGVQMNHEGVPGQFRFYDEQGNLYRETSFSAYNLLSNAKKFNIDISDLQGLGEQLDMLGIGYRPYELYSGTGSNHGIDFQDLMEGGLGTAYDWTIPRDTEGLPRHAVRKERIKQELVAELNLKPYNSDNYKTSNGD